VENGNGLTSNALDFEYAATGPLPIVFNRRDPLIGWAAPTKPTTADWGPDGKLYVGFRNGVVKGESPNRFCFFLCVL
jgi:hypothetical protein